MVLVQLMRSFLTIFVIGPTLRISLFVFLHVLTATERSFDILNECIATLIGFPSVHVGNQESAIAVLGVTDELGQNITMKLSELGYTVFAFYPRRPSDSPTPWPVKAPNVSSLLYQWHLRKEDSLADEWGTVAPIALDPGSATDRFHARETIQAYCSKHSKQLLAVIILPTSHEDEYTAAAIYSTSDATRIPPSGEVDSCAEILAAPHGATSVDLWDKLEPRELAEPTLFLLELLDVLRNVAGARAIVISGCYRNKFELSSMVFAIDDLRSQIPNVLSSETDRLGVRVCSIVSGPVILSRDRSQSTRPRASDTHRYQNPEVPLVDAAQSSPLCNLLPSFSVYEDELLGVIKHILRSRHPRLRYTIGLHPHMMAIFLAMPSLVQFMLRRFLSV